MIIEAIAESAPVVLSEPAGRAIDRLRVAVYHNLHLGGAKRVVHKGLRRLVRVDTWTIEGTHARKPGRDWRGTIFMQSS